MLKVNEEKLLFDYQEIANKKENGLAVAALDASNYATAHGYSDEQKRAFIEFVQKIQGGSLDEKEKIKLEILGEYIEQEPAPIDEEIVEDKTNENNLI